MNEKEFYEKIGNWDFSEIEYEKININEWNFFEEISRLINEKSICLDLGTGGGEKLVEFYPRVKKIIGIDISENMIKTAKRNLEKSKRNDIEFKLMNNLVLKFDNSMFDLVSARHTVINAKEIHKVLKKGGKLIVEGIDKKDCIELKEIFGRGQAFYDEKSISEIDYQNLIDAGFTKIVKKEIIVHEYYKTKEDLLKLLDKAPILDDFSEEKGVTEKKQIEEELLNKYVEKFKTEKGIFLKRVLYAIIAEK